MSEFLDKQFSISPLFLLSLKVFSKRRGPATHRPKPGARPSLERRPTKTLKGLAASSSMTFGPEEVQTKPLMGLRRKKKKKKKRVEQQQKSVYKDRAPARTKITASADTATVSSQGAGKRDFESFTHNSPSSPESQENFPEHEMQRYV